MADDFYGPTPARRRLVDAAMAVVMLLVAGVCVLVAFEAASRDGLGHDVAAVAFLLVAAPFALLRAYVRARNAGEVDV